ncbi:hypothetical protein LSUCC1028_00455 [Rhodobacterales bacterium LSUCC1028]|nr:hypothetical protein [Rhodobacterales bacterium LSUCC1028]
MSVLAATTVLLMGANMLVADIRTDPSAETTAGSCRYSLSNLAENHCVGERVSSYQDVYFSNRTSDNHDTLPLEDRWSWCIVQNLLSVIECTFLIRPDLDFMRNQVNREITRLMSLDNLSETSKRELEASQMIFENRLNVMCSIPEQPSFSNEWDERIIYGNEVCKLTHYAERLMFLSNRYEN